MDVTIGSKPAPTLEYTLVEEILRDRRRDRRWRIIRFGVLLSTFLGLVALIFISSRTDDRGGGGSIPPLGPYAALVRMEGTIAPSEGISARRFNPVLADAFADRTAAGVVVVINSPGGTPVQASLIHDRLVQLRQQYPDRKLIVVGEDMLTSGAYFIAVAAESIYVNPSSLTGSIGVVARNFGFVEAMKKLGVERRTQTAGDRKDQLDPFAPETAADREKLATILTGMHQHFIGVVKEGRGTKLRGSDAELFSGDFWLGSRAVELGLVDGLGSLSDVLQREFQVTRVREFRPSESWLQELMRGARLQMRAMLETNEPFTLMPY